MDERVQKTINVLNKLLAEVHEVNTTHLPSVLSGLSSQQLRNWQDKASDLLRRVGLAESVRALNEAQSIAVPDDPLAHFHFQVEAKRSVIKALLEAIATDPEYWATRLSIPESVAAQPQSMPKDRKRIFLVHGHNQEWRETVARFLEKMDLSPIILHEQPDQGRTIIEKFEVYADVGFAVVVVTGDDVGSAVSEQERLKPRARQNVILELGFFLGKLGRNFVVVLYENNVEIPSDYSGVLYVPLDVNGGWKLKLARELTAAGLEIDASKIL